MANNRKLTIQMPLKGPVATIKRMGKGKDRLVYLAVSNRPLRYPHDKSRIVYIGTTERGMGRIAESIKETSKRLFHNIHGLNTLEFFVVTCAPRQSVKTWEKLEHGLILAFKHLYGTVPKGNIKGKNQKWGDELEYFTERRLQTVLRKYGG